jgi:hypothetical protein
MGVLLYVCEEITTRRVSASAGTTPLNSGETAKLQNIKMPRIRPVFLGFS